MISQTANVAQRLRGAGAGRPQGMPDEGTLQTDLGHVLEAMAQSAGLSPLMSGWTGLR